MDKAKALDTLRMIREDIPSDLRELEGQEFTGPNVAAYLGNLAAVVDALAGILAAAMEEKYPMLYLDAEVGAVSPRRSGVQLEKAIMAGRHHTALPCGLDHDHGLGNACENIPDDICSDPGRKHSWRFDGDDPYIICYYCGQTRDALTGRVLKP